MDKVMVEVYVPILGRTFDMLLPLHSKMSEVLGLVIKAVTEMSNGQFISNETTTLSRRTDGAILNINLSVYELGICNGSKLMLV